MPDLEVHLFGRFSVQSASGTIAGLEGARVQELFAYLLLTRHAHSREALAELLWGPNAGLQVRKALRQSLWQLQTALGGNLSGDQKVVLVDADWVSINPAVSIWLDLDVFERAARGVHGVAGSSLSTEQVAASRDAVNLYGDGLLAGCYQEWCLCERERLQQTYIVMLDKLMSYAEATQAFEDGLEYGERILRCDRARERTHRRMMRLYLLSGDRTAALHQYHRCEAALKGELDVQPALQTRRMYEDLRLDRLESASEVAAASG